MEQIQRFKDNIWKNYIYILLSNLDLTRGLWMIYIATKGMSLAQLGMLEAIFHITSFIMEIPTGMVADIFGRKTSRIMGRIFSLIATAMLLYSNNFYLFAISFFFSAISYNLESGAGEALIYDSLKELGQENSFIKVSGIIETFFQIASVLAFIMGGYIATKSYKATFIITLIFTTFSLIQALLFKEIDIRKKKEKKNPFKIFANQTRGSIKAFISNKKIGMLMVFSESLAAFSTTLFFYLQNYWKSIGYSEFQIGIIFSVSCVLCALTGVVIHKIEGVLKEKGVLLILPIICMACAFGIAYTRFSYIFYILIGIVDSIIYVAISHYVNKLIPSENRATILSFRSMIFSAFMIMIFPVIGKLGDTLALKTAFQLMAFAMMILVIFNTITVIRINSKKKKAN